MKTIDEILEPITLSYWDSHQLENALHEEGEYVKLEDAELAIKEYAESYHESEVLKLNKANVSGRLPKIEVIEVFQKLKDAINDKGCCGNADLIREIDKLNKLHTLVYEARSENS